MNILYWTEDFLYIMYQGTILQSSIYLGLLLLLVSIFFSYIEYVINHRPSPELIFFLSSFISLSVIFFLNFLNIFILLAIYFIAQLMFISLFSHLLKNEK